MIALCSIIQIASFDHDEHARVSFWRYNDRIVIGVIYRIEKTLESASREEHANIALNDHNLLQALRILEIRCVDILAIPHHVHLCILLAPLADRGAARIACRAHVRFSKYEK